MTTVKLLQVRYAASPDGPWGEHLVLGFTTDEAGDWGPAENESGPLSDPLYRQARVVEYVPREPAQVDADVSELLWIHDAEPPGGGLVRTDATDPLAGSIAFSPRDADSFVRQHNAQVMKAAALRSRPAVVDAEVMALVERIDELHAKARGLEAERQQSLPNRDDYLVEEELNVAQNERDDILREAWPALSAALRSGRTK